MGPSPGFSVKLPFQVHTPHAQTKVEPRVQIGTLWNGKTKVWDTTKEMAKEVLPVRRMATHHGGMRRDIS